MTKNARQIGILLGLFAVTLLLWLMLLLFQFRVVNIFDACLMKFPGPWVVFGAMAFCPLTAMLLGMRMIRLRQAPRTGRVVTVAGGLFTLAFGSFIGVPLILVALLPKTPKNPSSPRPVEPEAGLAVFPGAEGFGTRTPAGRGGKIIKVTSLADDGPGTLRAALNEPTPRIIVFRISGNIELKSSLFISHPFVTVAGQTAPGDGICLKNCGLVITTHDVFVQHLRIRPGDAGKLEPDDNDCVAFLGAHGDVTGARRVVLDHISASWSEDEAVSTWYGAREITISWCIISEALNRARHRKGTHSAGLLIGDSSEHVSVHHCLLAHNDFRNPLIIEGGTHDFVNNVIYNWGVLAGEVVDYDSNSFLNFVCNYFLPGPSSEPGMPEIVIHKDAGTPRLFISGNIGPRRLTPDVDDWAIAQHGWDSQATTPAQFRAPTPFIVAPVSATSADEAFEAVLATAGASRPRRDAVDQRVVASVRDRNGAIINSPKDVGGYPRLASAMPPIDSDNDGMTDAWELKMGLDPNDHSDTHKDRDGDGYTNIEEYLHSLLH